MKKLVLFLGLFFVSNASFAIEVFDSVPEKKYEVISPISADKKSVDDAFKRLKGKGEKLKADAIINMRCTSGVSFRKGVFDIRNESIAAQCVGLAVKWK